MSGDYQERMKRFNEELKLLCNATDSRIAAPVLIATAAALYSALLGANLISSEEVAQIFKATIREALTPREAEHRTMQPGSGSVH